MNAFCMTDLINREGTEVRIKLRGEKDHRAVRSTDLPGRITAATPENCDPRDYDLVVLAMQEPQYSHPTLRALLARIAEAEVPCLSIMNMPPLAFLKRIPGINIDRISEAYSDPAIWAPFQPGLVTLCSPDPQAFRPALTGIRCLSSCASLTLSSSQWPNGRC